MVYFLCMKPTIQFTTEVFKEGDTFVAWSPELDVSSMGASMDDARHNLREAVTLFIGEAEKMGTLQDILDEAGYARIETGWRAPELLAIEKTAVAIS